MTKKGSFVFLLISLIVMTGCDKDDLVINLPKIIKTPLVETNTVFSITPTTAISGGNISFDGGADVTVKGICYANTTNPSTLNSVVSVDVGGDDYSATMRNLLPNTTYYVRAFATNSAGTGYGDEVSFKTLSTIPAVSTAEIINITSTTAICGGNVTSDGGVTVTVRGICYATTTANPTTSNSVITSGTGTGLFSSNLTNLLPNTTYYVRAFATNSNGTVYGATISFRTSTSIATLSTNNASSITSSSATSGGNITSDGGASITNRGICWSNTTSTPTTSNTYILAGTGTGSFSAGMTSLQPNTTYYVRAFAINSAGTSYANTVSFTTSSVNLPSITTNSITSIFSSSATSGGNITSDGGASITNRGICWSNTTSTPTTSNTYILAGSGTGSFSAGMTSLQPNTTYYVRAFAINSAGTSYGNAVSFTTSSVNLPSITTNSITSITSSSATSGGNITSDGGTSVTSRGVCWSNTTSSPTISNSRTIDGAGTGSFASSITGLTPSSTYYVRSYATNAIGTSYGSVMSFATSSSALAVGQSYQGGIIAYIFQSGDTGYIAGQTHGLIAATSDQGSGAQWGCSGTSINTSWNFGTGQNNTTLIVNGCSTSNTAARICNDLVSGGYSDWYLPSFDELNILYSNRTAIGGFSSNYYWSSSQYSATQAICVYFNGGSGYGNAKTSNMYVRAIRKF